MAQNKQLGNGRRVCMSVLAGCMVLGAVPGVFAATAVDPPAGAPELPMLAHARVVPDAVLARMRGRFVTGSRVIALGIRMQSEWVMSTGQRLVAGATLGVKLDGPQPRMSFHPNLTIAGNASSPAPVGAGIVSGSAITNANGVAQGIRVAGNTNSVANSMTISATDDDLGLPTGSVPDHGLHDSRVDPGSGATVAADFDSNGAGVSINVPGLGYVKQRLRGGMAGSGSGMLQLVRTSGSMQQISNTAHLLIRLRSVPDVPSASGFNPLLGTLQTMPK